MKNFDKKKIKAIAIVAVCILAMGGYYLIKKGGSQEPVAEEEIKDVTPLFGSFEASVGQDEDLGKTKAEIYEENFKSDRRAEAERLRAMKDDPTRIATRVNTFGKEEDSQLTYFGPEHYEQEQITNVTAPEFGNPQPEVAPAPTASYSPAPTRRTRTVSSSPAPKKKSAPAESSTKEAEQEPVDDGFGLDVYEENMATTDEFGMTTSSSNEAASAPTDAVISAEVFGDHNMRNGEVMRFRLTKEATIRGVVFPRNTVFTAEATFSGDRMQIRATTLEQSGNRVTADLSCYDQDQMQGISIPYNAARDGAEESTQGAIGDIVENSTGSIRILSSAAQTITEKLTREDKVFVRDGYKVTFRPNQR